MAEKSTSSVQDHDFIRHLADNFLPNFLESVVIEWISENLKLDQVFNESQIIYWVRDNLKPDEAFDDSDLREWAAGIGLTECE
jgi:hypothetical protein